jgi:FkbM family methyltransferase
MAILSYAQNREDVLLNRLFPAGPGGFYVDAGACHPVLNSVTKLFYERGWHGINIEPIPSLSRVLAQDRPRDINLHVGLSNREGTSTFYECLPWPELSTFSPGQAEDLRRQGFALAEHAIPVTTLARVCEQHVGRTIDFLKVDVESHEREVLEGADWGRYRPRVVVVEATRPCTTIPSHEDWESILLEVDYLFAAFDGINRYYVRAEDQSLLPLLGTPVSVFDHYEIYEHHRQTQEIRHALEAAQDELVSMRRVVEDSGIAVRGLQARLDAAHAELEVVRGRLAPFEELGPIALGVAHRLRRVSGQSPRLASMAKWLIRRADPRGRWLSSDT